MVDDEVREVSKSCRSSWEGFYLGCDGKYKSVLSRRIG